MNPEAHYRTTGPEIWEDSEGKITHFVCGMGTGGTISGVGRYLKEKNPQVKIIGVDPIGSLYYEFFKTGKVGKARTYVVEGIGEDIFPSTMDFKVLDDVLQVTDQECFAWRAQAGEERSHFHRRLGRRMRLGGAARGARVAGGQFRGGVPAGYGHALPEQGLQRRMDARARLRGFGRARSRPTTSWRPSSAPAKSREMLLARPYQTVFHALRTMQEQDISQLPVFEESVIVGTIYEDQILNLALQGKDLRKLVIREARRAHAHERGGNARRRTHELQRALGIGLQPQRRYHKWRKAARKLSLQDRGAGNQRDAKRIGGVHHGDDVRVALLVRAGQSFRHRQIARQLHEPKMVRTSGDVARERLHRLDRKIIGYRPRSGETHSTWPFRNNESSRTPRRIQKLNAARTRLLNISRGTSPSCVSGFLCR